jgi:hypothetical protein
MKQVTKLFAFAILLAGLSFSYSCKDKNSTDPDPDPVPAKTLKKELLYDKMWYPVSSGTSHKFSKDGKYGSSGKGTWEWLNDSDSMLIKPSPALPALIWYFKYCTEHEMSCTQGWDAKAMNLWEAYKDTQ